MTEQLAMLAILVGLTTYFQIRADRLRDWIIASGKKTDGNDDAKARRKKKRALRKGLLAALVIADGVLIVCGLRVLWWVAAGFEPWGEVIAWSLTGAACLHLPSWGLSLSTLIE